MASPSPASLFEITSAFLMSARSLALLPALEPGSSNLGSRAAAMAVRAVW
eukprot:CAMPEP_0204196380 /NCGR_PEP_ID=MMETSP0361-20130328/63784_1 /ASSEMBLY_ACC=CAM_ASM_000343 /TAXON_ID=268821 /ORGANISM="Scrippsiella Hangoei, Strain SHTV-5" /LENGTH=49 /DNA_ID= /DNA_START= /DNA_END= /DNA_ORIENTATION=